VAIFVKIFQLLDAAAEEAVHWVQPLSEASQAFLDSFGSALSILASVYSFRDSLREWAYVSEHEIWQYTRQLLDILDVIFQLLDAAAEEAVHWVQPLSDASQAFVESFGATLAILSSVHDFRNALTDWKDLTLTEIWLDIHQLLDVLDAIAQLLNTAAEEAVHWVDPLSDAAQAFVESFSATLAILVSVHDFRNALTDWKDLTLTEIWLDIHQLLDVLDAIAQLLNTAAEEAVHWVEPLSDAAQAFVESFSATLAILVSVHDFRNALSDWKDLTLTEIWLDIHQLLDVLDAIAQLLNTAAEEAVHWVEPLSDAAQAFVESFSAVLGILQTTFAFRQALADWSDEVKGKIWLRIEVLVAVLGLIALALNKVADEVAGWAQPLSEAAAAFVASLPPAVSLLQSAFAFRQVLADWSDEVKGKVQIRIETLVAVLGIIASTLNEAADKVTGWIKPLSDTAKAFIESVGAAVGVLQSAQVFREALGDWSDEMKNKVADRVAVLISVLGIIATELNKKAKIRWLTGSLC